MKVSPIPFFYIVQNLKQHQELRFKDSKELRFFNNFDKFGQY